MHINFPDKVFTVYQTTNRIELRAGCDDFRDVRVVCTTLSYENARGFAQLAAEMNHLPFVDYVNRIANQN